MKLTQNILAKLLEEKLSVEEILYLYWLATEETVWISKFKSSEWKKLRDRKLLEKDTKKISEAGRLLILNLLKETDNIQVGYSADFEIFWKTFPASDRYLHYPETRKLRTDKANTHKNYLMLLKEGYAPAFLKLMLEKDIENRVTIPSRDNPFKYMKGSVKWLADKAFMDIDTEVEAPALHNNDDLM